MILATRHGDREVRDANVGALLQMIGQPLRGAAGPIVSTTTMVGVPAAMACIRTAAWGMGQLELAVFRGEDVDRQRVKTTWQSRFFVGQPNQRQSWPEFWEETEACLTGSNNAYWLKAKAGGQVASVTLVPPETVQARVNPQTQQVEYRISSAAAVSTWLDSGSILHFRNPHVAPGAIQAPTPVQVHRAALASILAKVSFESTFYDEGLMQSLAVVFDRDVPVEEARRWKAVFQAQQGGLTNAHQVKVFGGGVNSVTTAGLSLEDAQFLEAMRYGAEDCARIFAVPPSLIWAVSQPSEKPITPEHEQDRWSRHGLVPRRIRIESRIKADPDFFGAGSRDYPQFGPQPVRGDVATETARIVALVQSGIFTPDEGRAALGYPPHPDGIGSMPQVTPVGGAPNPDPLLLGKSTDTEAAEAAT